MCSVLLYGTTEQICSSIFKLCDYYKFIMIFPVITMMMNNNIAASLLYYYYNYNSAAGNLCSNVTVQLYFHVLS